MIYNGTLFYLHYESESIVRYDLTTLIVSKLKIPRNRIVRNSGLPLLAKLYGPQFADNYLGMHIHEPEGRVGLLILDAFRAKWTRPEGPSSII